jgi:hypothetical protein
MPMGKLSWQKFRRSGSCRGNQIIVGRTSLSRRHRQLGPISLKRRGAPVALGDFLASHIEGNELARGFGTPMSTGHGEFEPFVGFNATLGRFKLQPAFAGAMLPHADVILSRRITLLGGLAEPHEGRDLVAQDALSLSVHHAQVELSQAMTLVRSEQIALGRPRKVLGHDFAVGEILCPVELGFGVGWLGGSVTGSGV